MKSTSSSGSGAVVSNVPSSMHTPGPFRLDGLLVKALDHGNWYGIAKVGGSKLTIEGNMANAEFIVRACNAHDDLVAALKLCKFDSLNMTLADLEFCRAALAKATQP